MKRRALGAPRSGGVASALPWRAGAGDLDRATLVLRGGVVYTGRAERPRRRGDRRSAAIAFSRSARADHRRIHRAGTRVVELRGGMVLPGIIDTHAHFVSGSLARTQVALDDAKRRPKSHERIASVRARTSQAKRGSSAETGNTTRLRRADCRRRRCSMPPFPIGRQRWMRSTATRCGPTQAHSRSPASPAIHPDPLSKRRGAGDDRARSGDRRTDRSRSKRARKH